LDFVAETNRAFDEGKLPQAKRIHLLRAYRNDQAEDYKAVLTPAQRKAFSVLGGVPLISAFWPPRGHFLLNPPRRSA
jgi:hypothetical protein